MNLKTIGLLKMVLMAYASTLLFGSPSSKILQKVQALAPVTSTSQLTYSQGNLPVGYGPCPTKSVQIFQAPGAKMLFCDHGDANIASTDFSIGVTMHSHYGTRYSNNAYNLRVLTVLGLIFYQKLAQGYTSPFTALINASGLTSPIFMDSVTTMGMGYAIYCPSSQANKAVTLLADFVNGALGLTITDADVQGAVDEFKAQMDAFITKNPGEGSTDARMYLNMFGTYQDATIKSDFLKGIKFNPAGSVPHNDYSRITALKNDSTFIADVKKAFSLMKTHRSYVLFGSSSDPTVLSSLTNLFTTFYTRLSSPPVHVDAFNTNTYGSAEGRSTSSTDQGTGISVGGIYNFGPVTSRSLLAAALFGLEVKDKNIVPSGISSAMSGSPYYNTGIAAGQSQCRFSYKSVPSSEVNVSLSGTRSNFVSRYANNANDGNLTGTNYQDLPTALLNSVSPGTQYAHSYLITHDPSSDYFSMIAGTNTNSYRIWLEIFYGSYKAIADLRTLSNASSTTKVAALKDAAGLAAIKVVDNTTNCIDIYYFPA